MQWWGGVLCVLYVVLCRRRQTVSQWCHARWPTVPWTVDAGAPGPVLSAAATPHDCGVCVYNSLYWARWGAMEAAAAKSRP